MIVEFLGAPGAGKTTLLPYVANFYRAQGRAAYTIVEAARPFAGRTLWGQAVLKAAPDRWQQPLLWQVFYQLSRLHRYGYFWRNRRFIAGVRRFQRQRPLSPADRHHVWYWFYHHAGYAAFLQSRARADEVLLYDEGFVHRVVQLFASEAEAPPEVAIGVYLDQLPRPDVVVVPLASAEVCAQRVYERGLWPRFAAKPAAETARYLANARVVVELALRHIQQRGWPVITVNNDGVTTAAAGAELRQKLAALPARAARLASGPLPVPQVSTS